MEKQTDSAAKIANLRQCTPKSGTSASLFFMPDLVKPQYTHGVLDQTTNISCLTTSSQTITYSQAISQTTVNVIQWAISKQRMCVSDWDKRENSEGYCGGKRQAL
jgi:hypothetical protein